MPDNYLPQVRIRSDGTPSGTHVTVADVMIPCTKISWTLDCSDNLATCTLEVPYVHVSAEAKQVLATVMQPNTKVGPCFSWTCPCGTTEAHPSIDQAATSFHSQANHVPGCQHRPTHPPVFVKVAKLGDDR